MSLLGTILQSIDQVGGAIGSNSFIKKATLTATSALGNSSTFKGISGRLEGAFPNAFKPNLKDETKRFGLNGWITTGMGLYGGASFGLNVAATAALPAKAPPPSSYYDGSGDLRHVNDMGAGPAYARGIMGSSMSDERYNILSGS